MTLFTDLWTTLRATPQLDLANFLLGAFGVGLMVRQSLWAFPVGLVAVTVQGVLFWRMRFYADATLQGFFFVALAYGWWHWARGKPAADARLPVTRLAMRPLALTLAATVAGWATWAILLRNYTDAAAPWRDAFIASVSVTAQVLQARKKLENWPGWVLANAVAVVTYAAEGYVFTALLFAIYLGLAVAGWRAWLRAPAPGGRRSGTVNA